MRVRTASTTASLVMVALSVAACSAGSSGAAAGTKAAAAPAAGASSGAASSTGTGASNAAAAPTNVDVCADLPLANASQITGTTFTTTKSSSVMGQIFDCEYDGAGGALLQISVTTQAAKLDYDGDVSVLSSVGHAPNKITGVGDAAYSMTDPGKGGSAGASSFASYGALFGNVYIKIGGLYVTSDQGKQIVEALHSKL